MITTTKIPFIAKTSNWKIRVILDVSNEDELGEYHYIEAATQALETCFGEDESKDIEMIALYDEDGKNFFGKGYDGDISDIPEPRFGVFIACYIEDDEYNEDKWWFFVTSDLFANASQAENFAIAKEYEKKWQTYIKNLREKQKFQSKSLGFKHVKKK
jgi:hypothetical protein